MTSVSVRFEEMTASHRFELQSETKDDHQQSRKLRKYLSSFTERNSLPSSIELAPSGNYSKNFTRKLRYK